MTQLLNIEKRYYCLEDWGYDHGRLYYSLAVAGVQFLLPSGVLMFVHAHIYHRLTQLPFWSTRARSHSVADGQVQSEARGQRTLYLLVSVVIVFMCSWLPLNLINILNDIGILDKLLE